MKGKILRIDDEVRLTYPAQGTGYVDREIILLLDKEEVLQIKPETYNNYSNTPDDPHFNGPDESATDADMVDTVELGGSNIIRIDMQRDCRCVVWLDAKPGYSGVVIYGTFHRHPCTDEERQSVFGLPKKQTQETMQLPYGSMLDALLPVDARTTESLNAAEQTPAPAAKGKRAHTSQRNEKGGGRKRKEAAKPADHPPKTKKPESDYVFRHNGDFWQIVFEGRELPPIRHLVGMTYLHALLSQTKRDLSALDLYRIANPPPPSDSSTMAREKEGAEIAALYGTGGGHSHAKLDPKTRQQLVARKEELQNELNDPDLDRNSKEENEEQIARIEKALKLAAVAKSTGGASFEAASEKQPRDAVCKAIERALGAIADIQKGGIVAKHLANTRSGGTVNMGKIFSYVGGKSWET